MFLTKFKPKGITKDHKKGTSIDFGGGAIKLMLCGRKVNRTQRLFNCCHAAIDHT